MQRRAHSQRASTKNPPAASGRDKRRRDRRGGPGRRRGARVLRVCPLPRSSLVSLPPSPPSLLIQPHISSHSSSTHHPLFPPIPVFPPLRCPPHLPSRRPSPPPLPLPLPLLRSTSQRSAKVRHFVPWLHPCLRVCVCCRRPQLLFVQQSLSSLKGSRVCGVALSCWSVLLQESLMQLGHWTLARNLPYSQPCSVTHTLVLRLCSNCTNRSTTDLTALLQTYASLCPTRLSLTSFVFRDLSHSTRSVVTCY